MQKIAKMYRAGYGELTQQAAKGLPSRRASPQPPHALQDVVGNHGVLRRCFGVIQTKTDCNQPPRVTREAISRIGALTTGGQPLPRSARAYFEPRFGHDFGQVRVHLGPKVSEVTRDLNARALTTGHHVFFQSGYYDPSGASGRLLLAHELAHVVQQTRPKSSPLSPLNRPRDPYERQAQAMAQAVVRPMQEQGTGMGSLLRNLVTGAPAIQCQAEPSTVRGTRTLSRRERWLADCVIMDFDGFEQELRQGMREAKVWAAPVDVFLDKTARRIRQITEALPSRAATLPILTQLVRLYQNYVSLLKGSWSIQSFLSSNRPLQETYLRFQATLQRTRRIPGIGAEMQRQRTVERETAEQEARREEAAQWVPEVTPDPKSPTSRICVGEFADPWRVYKIHRRGAIYAVNEENLRTATFTPDQWYGQRGFAYLRKSFAWLRVLKRNPVIQFLAGVVEGVGQGIVGLAKAILRIDQTLLAIGRALADLGATGRAIWASVLNWHARYVRSGTPARARMIGKLIGGIIFEIVLTKGIGRITMVKRAAEAASALRSRSVKAVAETLSRFKKATLHAAPALTKGITGAIGLLRSTRLLRRASDVLTRTMRVAWAHLKVGKEWFSGMVHVAKDAYYFLFDRARKWLAHIGQRLDDWAWGRPSNVVTLSALGTGALDNAAASLWRMVRQSPVSKKIPSKKGPLTLAAPRGLARLDAAAQTWLRGLGPQVWAQARRSFGRAGDDIIASINHFKGVQGFDDVVRDYLVRGRAKKEGARFVMQYASQNLTGAKALTFELRRRAGAGSVGRIADVFADGVWYEFKSVREVYPYLVKGGKGKLGQVQKDVILLMGKDLSRLRTLKWVFNGRKMRAAGLTEAQVAEQLGELLQASNLFRGHPLLKEIQSLLHGIVEFWP